MHRDPSEGGWTKYPGERKENTETQRTNTWHFSPRESILRGSLPLGLIERNGCSNREPTGRHKTYTQTQVELIDQYLHLWNKCIMDWTQYLLPWIEKNNLHKKKRKTSPLPSQEGEEDAWLGCAFSKIQRSHRRGRWGRMAREQWGRLHMKREKGRGMGGERY